MPDCSTCTESGAGCGSGLEALGFNMILSTHAIVGAALASLMPSHPIAAFAAGFASHFVIDSTPHWDYPLKSISFGGSARNDGRFTAARIRDFGLAGTRGQA
jgi:hypothetical protein